MNHLTHRDQQREERNNLPADDGAQRGGTAGEEATRLPSHRRHVEEVTRTTSATGIGEESSGDDELATETLAGGRGAHRRQRGRGSQITATQRGSGERRVEEASRRRPWTPEGNRAARRW